LAARLQAELSRKAPSRSNGARLRPLARSKGVLALAVDLESLAELVSVGTLITFYCTAAAVLWRRHCDGTRDGQRRTAQRLGATAALSFGTLQHLA
jgi:hypothetical protein